MPFSGHFLAMVGPISKCDLLVYTCPIFWTFFRAQLLAIFGHFWTILSSNFVNLGPRLTIFHRLPDHQGKSRASFEPPTLEFCDSFTFWSLQPLNFATVSHFGARRPKNAVLSSTLGSGGPKMLYCRQFCWVMFGYVRLCSVMFGYVRLCSLMFAYVRLCAAMVVLAWAEQKLK